MKGLGVSIGLIGLISLVFGPASAIDIYQNDLLKSRPGFSKLYKKMLSRERQLPAWLGSGSENRNTLEVPGKDIKVGDRTYFVINECWKPVCETNRLETVYDTNEINIWGRLTVNDRVRWLGNPPAEIRAAVEAVQER